MSISILSSTPNNGDVSVNIDSSIDLVFSKPVDGFSVLNGITIYSIESQTWTGSMMSQKDALTSDVKSVSGEVSAIEFSVAVSGSNVTILPNQPLKQKTEYFIQLAPGSDVTRFVSAQTFDEPIYSDGASGTINLVSSYTGKTNKIYKLAFSSSTEFDLMIDDIYSDTITFSSGSEILIDNSIRLTIDDLFILGDTATINVYASEGLSSLYKISFITSQYTIEAPTSVRIEDKLYASVLNELKVINSIPAPFSINNKKCNPIVIKFNRAIDSLQDLQSCISIHKVSLDNSSIKKIGYVYELNGSILKIYMQSVLTYSEITDVDVYDIPIDRTEHLSAINYITNI